MAGGSEVNELRMFPQLRELRTLGFHKGMTEPAAIYIQSNLDELLAIYIYISIKV